MTESACLVSAFPDTYRGWSVCPNCDGAGEMPYSVRHEPSGFCSCCLGSGIVVQGRHDLFGRISASQADYHGKGIDLRGINRGRDGGYILP